MIQVRVMGVQGADREERELSQIERSYRFALDRFAHAIREVEVWCSDVNGPRGGVDKQCRVQLKLHSRGVLTAKSSGRSFVHAAKDACDKARTLLSRRLSRSRRY
jgi:putative sigma-54 modulation protein